MIKYIVRCCFEKKNGVYTEKERPASNLIKAVKIRREMGSLYPNSYCYIVKVPFRKRHPDFPIWFSIASLLLVGIAPKVDLYIRHILQIMQRWI